MGYWYIIPNIKVAGEVRIDEVYNLFSYRNVFFCLQTALFQ